MIRRAVTLALCALAFWAGTRIERGRLAERCRIAGGAVDGRGLCVGIAR